MTFHGPDAFLSPKTALQSTIENRDQVDIVCIIN